MATDLDLRLLSRTTAARAFLPAVTPDRKKVFLCKEKKKFHHLCTRSIIKYGTEREGSRNVISPDGN